MSLVPPKTLDTVIATCSSPNENQEIYSQCVSGSYDELGTDTILSSISPLSGVQKYLLTFMLMMTAIVCLRCFFRCCHVYRTRRYTLANTSSSSSAVYNVSMPPSPVETTTRHVVTYDAIRDGDSTPLAIGKTVEVNIIGEKDCVVCMAEPTSASFQPCHHVCTCLNCAKQLRTCPLCRTKISMVNPIERSSLPSSRSNRSLI